MGSQVRKWIFGADLGFLDNKVRLTFDYFQKMILMD